jgi:hypothetical protein
LPIDYPARQKHTRNISRLCKKSSALPPSFALKAVVLWWIDKFLFHHQFYKHQS